MCTNVCSGYVSDGVESYHLYPTNGFIGEHRVFRDSDNKDGRFKCGRYISLYEVIVLSDDCYIYIYIYICCSYLPFAFLYNKLVCFSFN